MIQHKSLLIESDEITQKTYKTCIVEMSEPLSTAVLASSIRTHYAQTQTEKRIANLCINFFQGLRWTTQRSDESMHNGKKRFTWQSPEEHEIFSWTEFNVCNWSALHLMMMFTMHWIESRLSWRVNWIVELIMTWISFFHIDLGNPSLDAFFLRNVDLSLIPIHLQGIIRTIRVIVLGIISKLHNYQPSVFLWKLISI